MMAFMATRTGTAHVVTTTRRYKDRVYHTHLLRRSYREDGKVKNETLGNLSHLPEFVIELIRRSLHGETFVPVGEAFEICSSRAHGHVQAVWLAMQRLGLASLLASKACSERDLVLAMVAQRTRAWSNVETHLTQPTTPQCCPERAQIEHLSWSNQSRFQNGLGIPFTTKRTVFSLGPRPTKSVS